MNTSVILYFCICFVLHFRLMHPVKMVLGFVAISVAFGGYVYCTNSQWRARQFKRNHPFFSVIIVLAAGYLVVYMMGAVIVFMFGIAFPLLCEHFEANCFYHDLYLYLVWHQVFFLNCFKLWRNMSF